MDRRTFIVRCTAWGLFLLPLLLVAPIFAIGGLHPSARIVLMLQAIVYGCFRDRLVSYYSITISQWLLAIPKTSTSRK